MGVPDIQQAAKATDNFGLLKSSLEQCDVCARRARAAQAVPLVISR